MRGKVALACPAWSFLTCHHHEAQAGPWPLCCAALASVPRLVWPPRRCPCRRHRPGGGGDSVVMAQAHPLSPQHTFCRRCALKSGKALLDLGPTTSLPSLAGGGGVSLQGGPGPRPAPVGPWYMLASPKSSPQQQPWVHVGQAPHMGRQSSETHSSGAPGTVSGKSCPPHCPKPWGWLPLPCPRLLSQPRGSVPSCSPSGHA